MVTGRISLRSPEYSPISSSVSDVRAISSRFHCRPATVLVTRINVVALASAMAAAPTRVLPAPHGRTTTPDPPTQNPSTASCWYARPGGPEPLGVFCRVVPRVPAGLVGLDRVALPVALPEAVLGRPADLEQR